MTKTLPQLIYRTLASLAMLLFAVSAAAQSAATVFSTDFTTSAGTTYTTAAGAIGTSANWSLARSGADFGARITSGSMSLTNDASSAGNPNGWALASTSTAAFATPYNTTLSSNPGMVTWTFNMRQQQANPSGFASGNYGVAFILAGTSGTTNSSGTGYAVTLGNSGKTDPLKLVSYSAGLQTTSQILASNTTGLTDFGNTYLSVKVTYTPSTNTWQLYVRNDGSTFIDPNIGSMTSQGTAINSTYTATALPIMGAFWNANTKSNQTALYDNVKVTVVVPTTTAILPPSKVAGSGAFTLTVNGTGFVSGTSVVRWNGSNRTTTFVSATQLTASILSTDITSSGTATITVANGAAVSNGQTFTIDLAGVPNISLSTSALSSMTTATGTASSAQTYTVSGSNLTADVTVTAPTNFEVSPNGTTYSSSITLTRTGNVLVGQPVTVYARVKASAPSGLYTTTITHTTTSGATKSIAVSATVIASKPTTQATAVTFTTVTSTTFTVNWTNGNGANHLVLIRSGSAVNSNPVDGVIYTAINSFGAGSEIGTGNYTIYSGNSNTVNITGLQPNTAYYVAVYDYNGLGGTESYLTTSPAIGNRTTLNAPVGWQIYNTNTTNTITFDTTVDGVNEGTYQAAGLSPTLTSGELNSNAWAISGFSDGAIAFGGTSTDGQDFDRGIENGGVSIGGLYAFETVTNNYALGIQPATGDFVPGSATLRFQNQTGAAVTSVSIGYKVYVYNDQAASSSFNFSHSVDNSTYTSVSGLNVTSPATADASPAWKSYYRVVTLTGLNIANNNYYYFRWTGATVSGSTDFDEFGLDDIVMVANPSTNYASFSGTAENFAVLGNTTLSGSTTVTSDLIINGGKVDINGNTLSLNGTITNTTLAGLKGSASSNLLISGAVSPSLSFDQTTLGTTNGLNNLSINTTASNTVTISNPVVVNGTLTIALGQTLNMGTNALTGNLTTIANNGTIATQNTTSLPIPSGKTWSGTGTVHYNAASSAQTIVVGTYQNLTSSSIGGATAAGNITVNDGLNLPTANPSSTLGSLTMGTYTLTMGAIAANAGIGDVIGIVTRNSITVNTLYTFGNPYTSILFPNIGTLPTSMSLKIGIGAAPSWRTGAINRTYDFIQTGASGTKAVIKAHYLDSELNGNIEQKLVDWAYIVSSATTLEQGRSNYNTTDNWVELTNVNVALYFTGTFGQVLLTLDESAAGSLTWNGSVSNSWTTATNWTPNATPSDLTVVYIPDAATTPNDPTLNPSVLLGSLNIDTGGILNAPDNSQFTINNGAGAWINNGAYNPGAGTSAVIFTSANATMAGSTIFNNITINSGATLRPLTDNVMQIGGIFTLNGSLSAGALENTVIYSGTNQTIVNPNTGLQAYHNLIINGTGAIFPSSLNITDNLILNQAVDFTGKTIVMTGMEPQIISGSVAPTFNNLIINNTAGGVSLATNVGTNGTLTLTSGILDIANYNLLLGTNAVSGSFSTANMVVASGTGELRRTYTGTGFYTFPLGDITATVEYSPITISLTAGTCSNAYIGVAVVDGIHPNNSSAANNITRYWKVKESGITGAVATVTANYLSADITGVEGEINGGQLNGTFNQATNPWIKYAALASNSFMATGATLTAGQTSAFTGIKGGTYSALISGYGSFCLNDTVTLTATETGGDAPYSYSWNGGLGNQAIVSPPTSSAGTVNYTVTIKDSNGITVTDTNNITVVPDSVGGILASNQIICSASTPANLILSGQTGSVIYWQSASDLSFTTPVNIANITTTLTGTAIGPLTATTYFRAVVQSGTCGSVFSAAATISMSATTWNGTSWNNGVPNSTSGILITGNYTAFANLNGCTLTISNNAVVNIPSGFDVSLNGNITVEAGSTFTLENNANLLQANDVANSGNIIVKRNSSALLRQDYTLWSSPVDGQQLFAFSPLTVISPTSRFYNYNTLTNVYNSVVSPATTNFNTAQGYLIRVPNNHPATTPTIWTGQFGGNPHNGTINFNMADGGTGLRFNLTGNPYPSTLDAAAFVAANASSITGTLYYWRKTNNAASPSYCSWTPLGGFVDNGEAQTFDPLGVIQTGQGFFVEATGASPTLTYTNSQRIGNHANQFFRTNDIIEINRVWLNATNTMGAFSQILVGYITGATLGVDNAIDGRYINDGTIALTSVIDNVDYAIQGRPLPFDPADVVALNFKAAIAGDYTIAIDHLDGFFTGSQDILLRDNFSGSIHDLKAGAYTFTASAGLTTGRFEIIYQQSLSVSNPMFDGNSVIVYNQSGQIIINSGTMVMDHVQVFDIRGRLLAEKRSINGSTAAFIIPGAEQVLLLKITSSDNITVVKKAVN
ncbi:fibronectin type III domain-containing protein [Flavobacterium sp.]|uniref:fibronectin type III domain-containing protein n=1 Tax=Flavobacterium sp. TaxID=239 RepID=UPI00286D656F|nr:fibronectin type III domain-containing protein [Flavobacterium sp.]